MAKICDIFVGSIVINQPYVTCSSCSCYCHIKCLSYPTNYDTDADKHNWICKTCTQNILPFNHIEEDSEFMDAISKSWTTSISLSFKSLSEKVFNPFVINSLENNISIFDIDPDIQFFNQAVNLTNCNSDYFLEETFNKKITDCLLDQENLSLIHLNIRSAPKHLDEFELFTKNLSLEFSIIGLTETWFKDTNVLLYSLDGYNHEYEYRNNRSGGGVSLFIKNKFNYKLREDLMICNEFIESLFIELSKECFCINKNMIVDVVYRPPGKDISIFTSFILDILNIVETENVTVCIMGDYNINLLNIDNHLPTAEFLETVYSHGFYPLINKPTRIKNTTATLIDNIFTNYENIMEADLFNGILYTDISDRLPVFSVNLFKEKNETVKPIYHRQYTKHNIEKFQQMLFDQNWESVVSSNQCQESYTVFHKLYLKCYEECFPVKRTSVYKNRKPWLSSALKKSIKTKNRLYFKSIKNPTLVNLKIYKNYRNHLNSLLRRAERQHYSIQFQQNQNNLKRSWSLIKDVINKKSQFSNHSFIIGGDTVTRNDIIAEQFNKFFINVGKSLAKNIPETNIDPISFINSNITESMFLDNIDEYELKQILIDLKNTSPGYDGICAKIVKSSYSLILEPLLHVLNLSVTQGIFPNELKIAKVIPLYKGGDVTCINNYRPVSILPTFSKIFERIMHKRLMSFITKYNILYKFQFGFRQNYSTNMALIYLIDKIMSAVDNANFVIGIFLDLRKAFDTVNHTIMLNKLYKYGVRGIAFQWFKSYLSNRKQYVYYNNYSSQYLDISSGISQGSILGPIMFLLYVNDLVNVSDLFPILFADDTSLFLDGKNISDMTHVVNSELQKIVQWLNANKLSINIEKTKYIIFTSNKKKSGIYLKMC